MTANPRQKRGTEGGGVPERLRTALAAVPHKPGAYLLRDAAGRVVYVGKARDLRNRLSSYLGRADASDPKGAILRSRLASFDYIITDSETEALILEANLIKEHGPRYNVKLRDDKKYPFIKVTLKERFPRAFVSRQLKQDGSRYFGPYTDAKAMRRALRLVPQLFPIRQCRVFRLRPRPCLNFEIGRCPAPCRGELAEEEYGRVVRQLCLFLDGRAGEVVSLLEEQMETASRERRFEDAAAVRDRLADLRKIAERQRVMTTRDVDRDVVAIARHDRYGVASVLRIRHGRLVGCETCSLDLTPEATGQEILGAFITQFYSMATEYPSEILLDRPLEDAEAIGTWLRRRAGRAVGLAAPLRGKKKLLLGFARDNAALALKRLFDGRKPPAVVEELGKELRMNRPPRLTSGVDISTIGGALPVGTVVTFRDGRPDRSLYRRYRIRSVKGSDDYAMIREVVSRHLALLIRDEIDLPDLLLIDGGKGQLSAATEAVRESGVRGLSLAALAKREEEVFVPGRAAPLPIPEGSPAKRLLQRVRDEVHRFSVEYHRKLRRREARISVLDGVRGVGEEKKAALLNHFGSVAAIAAGSIEELTEVPGIGVRTAERIKKALDEAEGRRRSSR